MLRAALRYSRSLAQVPDPAAWDVSALVDGGALLALFLASSIDARGRPPGVAGQGTNVGSARGRRGAYAVASAWSGEDSTALAPVMVANDGISVGTAVLPVSAVTKHKTDTLHDEQVARSC